MKKKNFSFSLVFFLFISCSSHQSKSPKEKIQYYESRARTYQTLSDMQRLSPPYSTFSNKQMHTKLNNQHMRMAYLNEAQRYHKLAQAAREQLYSDSNGTGD